ncbi:MAG: hypothetical protein ABSG74_11405, partial [Candidatus Bathyarchaeia archaeon]
TVERVEGEESPSNPSALSCSVRLHTGILAPSLDRRTRLLMLVVGTSTVIPWRMLMTVRLLILQRQISRRTL